MPVQGETTYKAKESKKSILLVSLRGKLSSTLIFENFCQWMEKAPTPVPIQLANTLRCVLFGGFFLFLGGGGLGGVFL